MQDVDAEDKVAGGPLNSLLRPGPIDVEGAEFEGEAGVASCQRPRGATAEEGAGLRYQRSLDAIEKTPRRQFLQEAFGGAAGAGADFQDAQRSLCRQPGIASIALTRLWTA